MNGTSKIANLCVSACHPVWLLYASSREVYGQQDKLPVNEDCRLLPMNVYARSKLVAENMIAEARTKGLATAIVRFSNVYGDARDHADRVVPAFARAAVQGGQIRIDGRDRSFDFTHVEDVTSGVCSLVSLLAAGERKLPTIHLVSGIPTTLDALALLAAERSAGKVTLVDGEPRKFDVSYFYGDPSRASELLGWTATVDLPTGFSRLARDIEARFAERAAEPGLTPQSA